MRVSKRPLRIGRNAGNFWHQPQGLQETASGLQETGLTQASGRAGHLVRPGSYLEGNQALASTCEPPPEG